MLENMIYNEISLQTTENFLKRPAVEDLIKKAFNKPLITVIAGAGYGKTKTVLAALGEVECKSAWVQLSELDNHISRFWRRLAYALKLYNHSLFEDMLLLGYPETIAEFDQFLQLFARSLEITKQYILVFDDFHSIHSESILNFFEFFIDACIPQLSIVLISRTKPKLSLSDLLAKGVLARITENDLRFTEDEIEAYFHNQGIDLSKSVFSDIYSYTEGWIFAIYLVGLAIKKENIDNQNPVLAAKIDIFDLIEKEIFKAASKELQKFFIRASLLDGLPSSLLNELLYHDSTLITEMIQSNLLIGYDPFSDSYHFHNLFREFLLGKKSQLTDNEIFETHYAAAKWYKKNTRLTDALIYYKECGEYNEIIDIIITFTSHVLQDTANLFIELINQMPEEIIRKRPVIRVARAKFMFNNNRIEESQRELLKIRSEYETLPKTEDNLAILGETYIILGLISIVNQDYEFIELFKTADKYLPNGSRLANKKFNIAEGLNVCSIKDPSSGELKRHQDALYAVVPYASRVMNGCGSGIDSLNAAESSLYTQDFKTAEKYAYEAIYKSRQYEQYDVEYMANFVLVRIFTAKGKYAEISNILTQMQNQSENLQASKCISLNDIIKSWFYMKIGKTDMVANWIKYEEETRKIFAPVILGREYLVRSDCLLTQERYYELLAFMEQTDKIYEARGILYARIQNKITKAIIHHYIGNFEESVDALCEAYMLSHPNNLIMQFVEYGNKMRTVLHSVRLNETCKIPKEWLDEIYTKSSTYAKHLSRIVTDYNAEHGTPNSKQVILSKRESEILTCLCQGLKRDEIAVSCYLSLSTVNSLIKNIYNKLGASNLADAIRIAKEQNLP